MEKVISILKRKEVSFFVALLFVLSAVFFSAEEANAQIKYTLVVKIQGDIKEGVAVELSGSKLSTPLTKTTPVSGIVKFVKLLKGTYTVTPTKEGYTFAPETKEIIFKRKKILTATFTATEVPVLEKIGMDNCVTCHKSSTPEVYVNWLKGPHGNFNYFDTSFKNNGYSDFLTPESFTYPTDYTKFIGFPNEAFIEEELIAPEYAGKTADYCLACHGPFSTDNEKVAGLSLVNSSGEIDSANSTQVARPVIGCEMCHGAGSLHKGSPGSVEIPYKDPSASQCGQCHNKNFPEGHLTYHPAGAGGAGDPGVYEAYLASPHAKSLEDDVYASAEKKEVKALCAKCHTDEGARQYKDTDGDYTALVTALDGAANLTDFSAVQCRTCHDAHNTEELLEPATAATETAKARSSQFNTCTNCHQLLDSSDAKITAYHDSTANTTYGSDVRVITDTHFDDPSTTALEGYNIDKDSETACLNCHNQHSGNLTINEQWVESPHGDKGGEAWSHYDWKATNRQSCQKCHTATGFANYVADPATYNAANNDFSHLTGSQNEVLYCNACHTNSAFERRTLSSVTFPSGLTADLGDDSNLCMVCHGGRASKKDVDTSITSKGEDGHISSFSNIHYLPVAAILFGTDVQGGYEYSGKKYAGLANKFANHEGNLNTCVKCHMRGEDDHKFEPELSDCSKCHTGISDFEDIRPILTPDYDGDGDTEEGLIGEIETLEEKLLAEIKKYTNDIGRFGITYDASAHPYWFKDTDKDGIKDSAVNGTIDPGETTDTVNYTDFNGKMLRAAYNYHTSRKEPCGYIHNHRYIIELLIDSIKDLGGDVSDYVRP